MRRLYKWLLHLAKIAAALTFLGGIPYGLFQFWDKQNQDRISHTLDLFKQFNSAPFSGYQEKILSALDANKMELAAAARQGTDSFVKEVDGLVDKSAIGTDLVMTMNFFDAVDACVKGKLCDSDTSKGLFSRFALELCHNFSPYIEQQRINWSGPNFGSGLQNMAQMNGTCRPDALKSPRPN
jgi:hypothetical protein